MFTLRPYQQEAIDAVHSFICTKAGNPCVSTPTGSGKSVMMAALIKKWQAETPGVRGCILAHRKELVQQNYEKFHISYQSSGAGMFSAGINRRDFDSPILFASIDSIYKKSGDFAPFDFIFVDEAHRIPFSGEGKYRTFLSGCQRFNPRIRVVGWTATPWRMAGGELCHADHILNHVVYDVKITDLIDQGFLCKLRSKVGVQQVDLSQVKKSGGEYVTKSLAKATNADSVVMGAIGEAVRIIKAENRQAVVFYCVDVEHCEKASAALAMFGIRSPCLTGKTPTDVRDRLVSDFKSGRIHAICNVNVLTEGFDAPHIDCVVLLRPTMSSGLYSQMVGRGLRLHPRKADCLVLDFSGCIDEHGPIDLLGGSPIVMACCQRCRESFSRAIRVCPACGWIIPPQEVTRLEEAERERRMHGTQISTKSILSDIAETLKVDTIYVGRHTKYGSPDSARIQFRCGLRMFRTWLCLDHPGQAGILAHQWWRRFFGDKSKDRVTVNMVLSDLFISESLLSVIHTITVKRSGKYFEVIDYNKEIT